MRLNLKEEFTLIKDHLLASSLTGKWAPLLFAVGYPVVNHFFGIYRLDHLVLGCTVAVLWYLGPRMRAFFNFILPLILVAIVYDSMRIYADAIRGPIHVVEPYWFDQTFFGIKQGDQILTPNEWWQLNTHPILDFITGFFYLTFISIYVLISFYLCLILPKRGTKKRSGEWILNRAYLPMWAFFWVNVVGYSTYYWYAAAPPWYVAEHGLGPADLSVHASAAGAIRFDELLGTKFFSEMYGRSADVFGAVPSLHVAYPLQSVYYAFQYGSLRISAVLFYLVMCFSAVYLNHHYILDILWGSVYALIVCVALNYYAEPANCKSLKRMLGAKKL